MGIAEACSRFLGDFLQALKCSSKSSVSHLDHNYHDPSSCKPPSSSGFELAEGGLLDDEVPVEEVLGELEDMSKRSELLHEAFKIFDEDGDGYIDAMELKRVLDCLGLDKGWDMSAIEKMVKVADLNFDGKVYFGEFELMMG